MLKLFVNFFLIILVISMTNSSSSDRKSSTALFISIPFIGHLNPLLRQATELYHRPNNDYNIYIISCSNMKTYVENYCLNTSIQFIDIGPCMNESDFQLLCNHITSDINSLSNKLKFLEIGLQTTYPLMYEQMLQTINPDIFQQQKRVIAIVDLLTFAGADIADHFNITYIINNADLLPYLGWYYILPADYNPTVLLAPPQSIYSIQTNLFLRTILPLTRYLISIYSYFQLERPFNILRQTKFHLNNSIHVSSRYHSHMILVNSVFGIEYAQHLPPHVQCTGPMFSMKLSRDYYLTQLTNEDRQWLEIDSRPIIYVNFGTVVLLSNELIEKILLALKSFEQYRVLWKLDKRHQLPINVPSTIRIVPWISSTFGYLVHFNVQLFISHCGINSAYESIWAGTSILCIPFFGDQHDMAQRLTDAGVGRWLNHLTSTSENLRDIIIKMFEEKEKILREENLRRIQTMMRLHGGVEKAVDFIEMVAEYGTESLIPLNNSYPWYAYYNLDVYAIWLLLCFGLRQVIVHCCCRCRHRIRKTKKIKAL
ncbi:hypothetical protein I4U23_016607 [Adineta vaga]|nr:hypothetical protein I4U23_016607 [Adineta vaga]